MHKTLCAFSLALLVAAVGLSAQQAQSQQGQPAQPPRFRVEVNYVEVDAVVTDAQGNFVRNLTRDDFEVLEGGKPQEISTFSVVDVPIERGEAPLLAPNVLPDI